jgi:hypothetical protein
MRFDPRRIAEDSGRFRGINYTWLHCSASNHTKDGTHEIRSTSLSQTTRSSEPPWKGRFRADFGESLGREFRGARNGRHIRERRAYRGESIRQLRDLNTPTAGVQKRRHLPDVHRLTDFRAMPNPVQRLLILLAHATDRELARQVQYLKYENRVLRARLPQHIMTTPAERARLLKYGRPVGLAINQLITVVVPGTFTAGCGRLRDRSGRRLPKSAGPKSRWISRNLC